MKVILGFDYREFRIGFIPGIILGIIIPFIVFLTPGILFRGIIFTPGRFWSILNLSTLIPYIMFLLSLLGVAYLKLKKKKSESDNKLAGLFTGIFCGVSLVLIFFALILGVFITPNLL